MKRRKSARGLVVALATTLVLILCVEVARPILQNSGPREAEVTDLGGNQWEIRNRNYTTLLTTEEEYGAVGLEIGTGADASVVVSVDTADLVLAGTSTTVGYVFAPNATVTAGFNAIQAGTWSGFHAQSPGTAAGTMVDLVFTLTTMPGTTFAQLSAELQAASVGTSEADSVGNLTMNTFINPTGTVSCMNCPGPPPPPPGGGGPAMDDTWLLLLGALTIVIGLLALRTRRRVQTGGTR